MTKDMTPFRSTTRGGLFSGDDDEPAANGVRLFGEGATADHDGDEHMDSMSPPRVANKNGELPTADLFGNNGSSDSNDSRSGARRRRMRTTRGTPDGSFVSDADDATILRNMDMNASSPSSSTATGRKRPSDHYPAGREDMMEESDDDDMFVSPRASPTFRTMDGRTVTSKNPFSPFTPTHDEDFMSADTQTAPTFPDRDALYGSHTSFMRSNDDSKQSADHAPNIRPKVNLLRRDAVARAPQQHARAGYPDPHGMYSFTGSPIEEIDIMEQDSTMGNKIRRLKMGEDASTTAHSLFVDTAATTDVNNTTFDDGISPADVMNFPTPPSAPKKAARPARYTPLKKVPPQTPMPARRNVARRPDDHDEEMDTGGSAANKSRFYQDFDIIGELGMGSFGTVYRCLSRLDGCMYAVKAAKRKAKGIADRDRMLKEVCKMMMIMMSTLY